MLNKVSFCLILKNEGNKIRDCLESIKDFADEIIAVHDGECADNTLKICEEYGAKIFINKLKDFSSQRNFASSKAENNIVLHLDGDERLTNELKKEIINILDRKIEVDAYKIPRKNFIAGKWLKGGGWGPTQDCQTRLYDRNKCNWTGLVHEILGCKKVETLKNYILHNSSNNFKEAVENFDDWTSKSAEDKIKKGKKFNIFKLIFFPSAEFIRRFFLLKGFKDGLSGLKLSLIQAWGRAVIEYKLKKNEL